MVGKTQKEIILDFLRSHQDMRVKDIAATLQINHNSVQVYLLTLMKDKMIQRTSHGRYKVIEAAEVTKIPEQESDASNQNGVDLENVSTIVALKKLYGRKKLLKIVENIKEMLKE